jgi:hypothetical protein
MTIEEIRKEAEVDLKMDSANLDGESLRIPQLHNKYLNFHTDARLFLRKLRADRKLLYKTKWEYYTGKMPEEELKSRNWQPFEYRLQKQDIEIYVDADPDIQALDAKIAYQEEKVDYLEQIVKGINNRQWNLNNAIQWRKYINGVN